MLETYSTAQEAIKDAQDIANDSNQSLHVIYSHGKGYEIVTSAFKLNRSYYHDSKLGKVHFDFIETLKPELCH